MGVKQSQNGSNHAPATYTGVQELLMMEMVKSFGQSSPPF